jgi:glycosidase
VNGIWLSPCFTSPFKDGGYDITDFRQVDPRYGSLADLQELFDTAHRKGIKVILDLVAGHTSTEHPWFKASCKAQKNQYSNYYIWNEDWLDDADSMPMINGYAERNGNFATNFFASQPALNYGFAQPSPEHPWQLPIDHPDVLKVGQELRDIMRFFLKMGCDGFRVDMAPSLIKKDPGRVANIKFWQKMRQWFDEEYPDRALEIKWLHLNKLTKNTNDSTN